MQRELKGLTRETYKTAIQLPNGTGLLSVSHFLTLAGILSAVFFPFYDRFFKERKEREIFGYLSCLFFALFVVDVCR
jgi:hypothetical protein